MRIHNTIPGNGEILSDLVRDNNSHPLHFFSKSGNAVNNEMRKTNKGMQIRKKQVRLCRLHGIIICRKSQRINPKAIRTNK